MVKIRGYACPAECLCLWGWRVAASLLLAGHSGFMIAAAAFSLSGCSSRGLFR